MATISTSGNLYTLGHSVSSGSIDMYIAGSLVASGFLDTENVVFYHPLDNYTDGIQGDSWGGSAAFGPAIISDGIGSARLGGPLVSQGTSIAQSRYLYGSWLTPIINDDDRALLFYNYGDDYVKANILTTSENEVVVEGTDNLYPISGGISVNTGQNQAIHVSGNFYAASVAIVVPGGDYAIMLATATVNGATISWNTPIGFGRDGQNVGTYQSLSAIPDVPSGGFLLSHSNAADDNIRIHYCHIDDTGNVYAGAPIIITSGQYAQVGALSSNKAIITYEDLINNQNTVRIINISGTILSLEDPISYIFDNFHSINSLSIINSSGFLTGNRLEGIETCNLVTHRVSGSTIDAVSSGVVSGIPGNYLASIRTTYDNQQSRGLYQFTNYGGSTEAISCGYFTIDDDYNIDVGNRTDYSFTQNLAPTTETSIAWLGNDKFLSFIKIFVGATKTAYVIQDKANEIYSQIPSAYPQAMGVSGLTLGAWTNMSNISGTIFKAGRDCNINVTSGCISLGSGTAYWNDLAITDLISSIDDDQAHFLIVDFRYQGENNWKLYTSLDGQNWVDQGVQNSGSQGPIETTSAPNISFADEDTDQLLDEVILWKDVDQFDVLELLKLHALGDTYDKRMDQYQETDIILYASGNLSFVIEGHSLNSDSSTLFISAYNTSAHSGDLFIGGLESPSGSINLFIQADDDISVKPIDWLLKSSDHYPQILGTLSGATSVNIQLWEVTDGQNTAVSVASSGCYQIGDTGRWGWSTSGILSQNTDRQQYFYLMTADNGETFDGQFFLEVPERAKWVHPNNFNEYLG